MSVSPCIGPSSATRGFSLKDKRTKNIKKKNYKKMSAASDSVSDYLRNCIAMSYLSSCGSLLLLMKARI